MCSSFCVASNACLGLSCLSQRCCATGCADRREGQKSNQDTATTNEVAKKEIPVCFESDCVVSVQTSEAELHKSALWRHAKQMYRSMECIPSLLLCTADLAAFRTTSTANCLTLDETNFLLSCVSLKTSVVWLPSLKQQSCFY